MTSLVEIRRYVATRRTRPSSRASRRLLLVDIGPPFARVSCPGNVLANSPDIVALAAMMVSGERVNQEFSQRPRGLVETRGVGLREGYRTKVRTRRRAPNHSRRLFWREGGPVTRRSSPGGGRPAGSLHWGAATLEDYSRVSGHADHGDRYSAGHTRRGPIWMVCGDFLLQQCSDFRTTDALYARYSSMFWSSLAYGIELSQTPCVSPV